MIRVFSIIFLFFLINILSGCAMFHRKDDAEFKQSQIKHNVMLLSQRLSDYNVRVFQSTNLVKLVLLNKVFFTKNSANFTGDAYEALDLISSLSHYYTGSSVAVTGYTVKGDKTIFSEALAKERARRIMAYLWKSKIGSNFVYAVGKRGVFDDRIPLSDCIVIEYTDFL